MSKCDEVSETDSNEKHNLNIVTQLVNVSTVPDLLCIKELDLKEGTKLTEVKAGTRQPK